MRNTLEFPITRTEIVDTLLRLAVELAERDAEEGVCGDMRPILLETAAKIVATSAVEAADFNDPVVIERTI